MSAAAKIQLTQEAQKIVANLQTLSPKMMQAVADGMKLGNQFALAKVKQRLVGVGPFPPEQHRLGRRSGSLYSGVRASDPVIDGQTVDTTIGTNVTNKGFSYAALHEFGGRVHVKGREHKVRLRTDAKGNLLRQLSNSKLAIFAGRNFKHAVERTGQSKDHDVIYPERAPFRTGIGEAMPSYKREVSKQIVAAWNDLKN